MPEKQCPKCHFPLVEDKASLVCPNCDYVKIKTDEWKGIKIQCPKCDSHTKVYKSADTGKTFHCDKCKTIGRFVDEKELKAKVYTRDSPTGKRLSWLFEVPCKYWHRRETVRSKHCKVCDIRPVCDAHSDEIDKFLKKKKIDVFISGDYIEVVPKD